MSFEREEPERVTRMYGEEASKSSRERVPAEEQEREKKIRKRIIKRHIYPHFNGKILMLVTDVSRSPLEMGKVIKSKSHRGNVKMVTTTCVQSLIIHFIYYRVKCLNYL